MVLCSSLQWGLVAWPVQKACSCTDSGGKADLRHNIRIKGLPVRILQMLLLRRFLLEALDDSEFSRVVHILHDEPIDGFAVFVVDSRGFDELSFDLVDASWVAIGVEVAD